DRHAASSNCGYGGSLPYRPGLLRSGPKSPQALEQRLIAWRSGGIGPMEVAEHRVHDAIATLAVESESLVGGDVQLARQRFPQQAARTEIAGAHGGLGNLQAGRGLLHRELLQRAQDEDGAENLWKRIDAPFYERSCLDADCRVVRQLARTLDVFDQRHI